MNDPKRPCDLCSLPVGKRPFVLHTREKTLQFCCDGCLGIYRMLNNVQEVPAPPADSDTQR
jgi:hypothetical protein